MSNAARISVLLGLLVTVGSCSTVSYIQDWDTQRDFSAYQSFAWFERPPSQNRGQPPTEANSIVTNRIRRAVSADFERRGLVPEPVGEADIFVTYYLVLRARTVLHHSGWAFPYGRWGWGYGWGWGGGWTSARTFTEGTLVVDVLDGKRRELVWRGIADGAFRKPNPTDEQVARVVTRVLEGFPPA
jgi:hypothetical protein